MGILAPLRGLWQMGRRFDRVRRGITGDLVAAELSPYQSLSSTHKEARDNPREQVKRYINWIYTCANLNARTLASIPLKLFVKTGPRQKRARCPVRSISSKQERYLGTMPGLVRYVRDADKIQEVLQHPFLTMMEQVNLGMNQFELKEFIDLSQEITGNCFILVVSNTFGMPVELHPLLPQLVTIKLTDDRTAIKAFKYGFGEKAVMIPPEKTVHFKFMGIKSTLIGTAPLEAVIPQADIHEKMNTYEEALFDNRAVPDVWFESEFPVSDPQAARLHTLFKQLYGGASKAGNFGIGYGIKPHNIAFSPREMNFLMGRKLTRQEITAAYGVPEGMVTADAVNLANARVHAQVHAKNAVLPRCLRIQQKLNESLIPMFDDSGRLFCAFDNPVPEDTEDKRAERQNRLSLALTTVNEEREKENLEPVPWGDVPILPMNMVPLGTPGEPEKEELPPERMTRAVKRPEHSSFTATLKGLFQKQLNEVLTKMPMEKSARASYPLSITDEWVFDEIKWTDEIADSSAPFLMGIILNGAEAGTLELPISIGFDVETPQVQEFLSKYPFKFAQKVNQTTADRLRVQFTKGIQEGENTYYLRERAKAVFGELENWRADRIARTETARAFCAGREMAWMQSGVVAKKEWYAQPGACAFCMELNGTVVALGTAFAKDSVTDPEGHTLDITYEDTGVGYPPLHPHCMCDILPVIEES